jgi:hypothetical protein
MSLPPSFETPALRRAPQDEERLMKAAAMLPKILAELADIRRLRAMRPPYRQKLAHGMNVAHYWAGTATGILVAG